MKLGIELTLVLLLDMGMIIRLGWAWTENGVRHEAGAVHGAGQCVGMGPEMKKNVSLI